MSKELHIIATENFDGAVELECPACEFNYTSYGEPSIVQGKDNYEAGWGGRGDLLVIPMECENGHSWELCFGFHKGCLYPLIRNVREDSI